MIVAVSPPLIMLFLIFLAWNLARMAGKNGYEMEIGWKLGAFYIKFRPAQLDSRPDSDPKAELDNFIKPATSRSREQKPRRWPKRRRRR